jgi:23S rRNA U2552 (ribose-2'-O)-methylase RlmE/FtsJ
MSSRPRQEGYRSRAVYKLIEIDDKHKILDKARPHHRPRCSAWRLVADLGSGRPIPR